MSRRIRRAVERSRRRVLAADPSGNAWRVLTALAEHADEAGLVTVIDESGEEITYRITAGDRPVGQG